MNDDAPGSVARLNISVIVPVYNTSLFLEACIAALQAQDYPQDAYEILMVDNNSTDDSAVILARAQGIRALQEMKQGSYAARNRAVREARGAILAFTDSDCLPEPGWLQSIDAAFSDPCLQIVQGFRRSLLSIGCMQLLSRYEQSKSHFTFSSLAQDVYYGYTNNMAVRRETYDRYGPFIELSRGSDTLFVRKVIEGEGCGAIAYSEKMVVVHAEMNNIAAYFRKMFIYGRAHKVKTRNISSRERRMAFQSAVGSSRSPLLATILLFSILSCGLMSWNLGRLGRLRLRWP